MHLRRMEPPASVFSSLGQEPWETVSFGRSVRRLNCWVNRGRSPSARSSHWKRCNTR